MNVAELLDELRGGILRDTTSLISGNSDLLWTDDRLVSYINQAHIRFCKRTQILRDNTTPTVTQITLVAGQSEYTLDKSVLAVLSVRYNTDTVNLPRASVEILDTRAPVNYPWFDVNTNVALPPGRPRAWTTDQAFRTFRVYPAPTATEEGTVIYMRVARLPLVALTVNDTFAVPEVPEEYHFDLLEWAAFKALSNMDPDSGNVPLDVSQMSPADKHKVNFDRAVDEAISEAKRETFAPSFWDFRSVAGVTYSR